jgi:hypothetical protein
VATCSYLSICYISLDALYKLLCLPVNSSLRLQLVATCSYLSICYISLDALYKLLKFTICFVMSVRPSVRKEQLGFRYKNLYEIQHLKFFPISVEISQFLIKSNNYNRYITVRPLYICDNIWMNCF